MFTPNKAFGANALKAKKRKKTTATTSRSIAAVLRTTMALALFMSPLALAFGSNLCDGTWQTNLWADNESGAETNL